MAEHEIRLHALRNSNKVVISSSSVTITDGDGFYAIDAQPGLYRVDIKPKWKPAYNVGEIAIYIDSPSGTLNDYLLSFGPSDLKPDVVHRFEQLVVQAESAAQSAAESKSEAAKFAQTAEAHATQAAQAQQAVASSAEQVIQDKNVAVAAASEAERCATEAGEHRASALDAVQRAEQAALGAEHVMDGAMRTENCLSEIAALGEEAKHNARQNLGMGNAAVMDVQQDIYDRTAGRAALPGAFGYGARLMNVSRFSSESGPSEFLDWVRRAKPGRYQVSQYSSSRYTPIIDGVVFRGIVEVIFTDAIYEEYNPHLNDKIVIFYGVNGEIFFNRYTSSSGGALLGWENWKLKIDDFTNTLWSYTKPYPSSVALTPDVGGLIVAVYTGKNDGDSAIALSRPAYIPGSRLKMADMKLTSSGSIEVVFENFTISGSYRALSGFSNQSGAPSEKLCLGVFVRVR
ncbi:tail fiber protein [Shigella sonnei]|nr:tail fiber protein [Shigella sonnei]